MDISNHGVEFTASFENVYQSRYCPYYDPYGQVWSRAYGETDWSGNFGGRCISHAEALNNLRNNLNGTYGDAVRNLNVPLNQNQFDSLTDFAYNLGPGSMQWNVGQSLRERKYDQAANQMLEYNRAGGVVLIGLVRRREAERRLFLTPAAPVRPPNPLDVFYLNERRVVNSYLAYMKHPKLHSHGIKVSKEKLVVFRKNIYDAAVYGRLNSGKKVDRGWNINHRYNRYQLLKKYTS